MEGQIYERGGGGGGVGHVGQWEWEERNFLVLVLLLGYWRAKQQCGAEGIETTRCLFCLLPSPCQTALKMTSGYLLQWLTSSCQPDDPSGSAVRRCGALACSTALAKVARDSNTGSTKPASKQSTFSNTLLKFPALFFRERDLLPSFPEGTK